MELVLFGLGFFLLFATWRWMLKPSLLDATRDKLFDLRESMRAYFVGTKEGLDHPAYKDLRMLLNGHLRYTEDLSFVGFVLTIFSAVNHKEDFSAVRNKLDRKFNAHTESEETRRYIKEVRFAASAIMLDYMIKTSLLAWFFAILGTIVTFVQNLKKLGKILANSDSHIPWGRAVAAMLMVSFTTVGLGNNATARETLENSALHSL